MHQLLLAEAQYADNAADGFNLAMLLFRAFLGFALAAHGYNKFFGGGKIPGTAGWFDSMGMKPNGKVHAILAASTEMGAGTLLVLGLATPLAAAGFVGLMFVAGYTVHRKNGFFSAKNGYELNALFAVSAVAVAAFGPGQHSLDWRLGIDASFNPYLAGAVAAGLGLAGGIGLVAACYRPPADDES